MNARDAWDHAQGGAFDRIRRAFVAMFVLAAIFITLTDTAQAKYASYVIDADTGEVLHATNADTRNYPASLTKMMTLYLVFERLQDKRWTMYTKLKVSHRAARQPASKLALKAGSTITVKDAILALVTKSANDVATTIAENISGKERNFALKMTAKARSLGMARTTFRNASGLPHRAQMSTAKDMSILARALLRDFPQHYHLFSTKSFKWKGRTYRNHNKLLDSYPGVDGLKTGYIRASGFNLAASASRDGRRIIGIVFGGRSSRHRNTHMVTLLDKGFRVLRQRQAAPLIAKADVPDAKPTPRKNIQVVSRATGDVWAVQVGAFLHVGQARRAAEIAISKAPRYLGDGQVRIVPLEKRNGKILQRARIVGISKRDAFRTCKVLKDCMELKAPASPEFASVGN